MRKRTTPCFLLVVAMATAALAQTPVDAVVRAARQMIDAGHPSDALASLDATDMSGFSPQGKARIYFYEARCHQEMGDEGKAAAAYELAVTTEPDYGAALNNLAQILSRRNDNARAAALLKKAVSLADPRHLLYLSNYGAIAEKGGDLESARKAYAQLAAEQPDNVDAQVNAIRLLDDPTRMALQLVKLANRGEVGAAQSLALDLISKAGNEAGKRGLLSVVAGTMAGQHIDPHHFDAAPVAKRIAAFRDDPMIGDGVASILHLYQGITDPDAYQWWTRRPWDERFAALIRDVGSSYQAAAEKKNAEGCFRLALFYAKGADPDAFIDLADLYYADKRIADLDQLAHQYEGSMFAAKGETIAKGDYASEYRFHVALGTMYAYLQRWGSDSDPTSAIFQLAQAQRAAADYNRTVSWGPRIPTDPKTLELLATGYEKINDLNRAVAVRINAADTLLTQGRKSASLSLLKPIAANPAIIKAAEYIQRYATVTARLAKPVIIDNTIQFPDAIDVTLTPLSNIPVPASQLKQIASLVSNYATAETDRDRDRVEQTLHKVGVTYLDPTTMSRTAGEFTIDVAGKPVRYKYLLRVQNTQP